MEKSLNQQWKESGTTLSYREWRRREDEKMSSFNGLSSIPNINLGENPSFKKTMQEIAKKSGYTEEVSNKTVLGINKYVLLVGALIVVGAVGYKIYKKYNK